MQNSLPALIPLQISDVHSRADYSCFVMKKNTIQNNAKITKRVIHQKHIPFGISAQRYNQNLQQGSQFYEVNYTAIEPHQKCAIITQKRTQRSVTEHEEPKGTTLPTLRNFSQYKPQQPKLNINYTAEINNLYFEPSRYLPMNSEELSGFFKQILARHGIHMRYKAKS